MCLCVRARDRECTTLLKEKKKSGLRQACVVLMAWLRGSVRSCSTHGMVKRSGNTACDVHAVCPEDLSVFGVIGLVHYLFEQHLKLIPFLGLLSLAHKDTAHWKSCFSQYHLRQSVTVLEMCSGVDC